ncbi:zinc/manganese/metal ions ABC transporter ATP-binding protein [Natronorubrum sulfidifaciens JCM 14089]|uniref:Cobalamin import ATP-binding protein BtuD n=1 Tax=Natronorubrum sulfidifaciens JCM 14089 TaxID=1230460 RepID=L9W2I0_9EURY|nr:zinc/manganese/metal ions ABC transporter ATP-binding protein [Natronorubrum sulfidifaciens JCM 14089]
MSEADTPVSTESPPKDGSIKRSDARGSTENTVTPIVDVQDVTFAYGEKVAVEDISLTIEQGDFVGLIGPNGSGKTTLLHLMLGLRRPDSGTVELFGQPSQAFDDGERIGYVSQRSTDRGETMPVTVREVVLMGRFAHAGHSKLTDEDHEIVDKALETVEIGDLADRQINQLSGGQRQRAFIARALASEADLLALDEPTVGVDAESRDQFYGLLDDLNQQGITIILIEHDIDILTRHVNKIACINRELYHHGKTVSFLESDALAKAYGAAHGVVEHDHP